MEDYTMFNQDALTEFYRRSKELKDKQQNGKIVKMASKVVLSSIGARQVLRKMA
jgi:hypothetical protein